MKYKLYNRLGSAGLAIEAVLRFAAIPFDLIEIESRAGEPAPESFKKINPWGQFPTLILPEGETLTEASAILVYLAAAHPETPIGPSPGTTEHARFVRWTIFAAVNVHEAMSHRAYPFRFAQNQAAYPDVAAAATIRMTDSLLVLDEAIGSGPFLLGDNMCGADIYFAMFYAWSRNLVNLPRLEALSNRVRLHEAVAPVWLRHIEDRIKSR